MDSELFKETAVSCHLHIAGADTARAPAAEARGPGAQSCQATNEDNAGGTAEENDVRNDLSKFCCPAVFVSNRPSPHSNE